MCTSYKAALQGYIKSLILGFTQKGYGFIFVAAKRIFPPFFSYFMIALHSP